MILVKTKIGPSKIHGMGLFASQFIPKGTMIWKFVPNLDIKISKARFKKLPILAKKTIIFYGYSNNKMGKYFLDFDNGRFVNHSYNPNMIDADYSDDTPLFAARNIKKNEELTCDYSKYDDSKNLKNFR